MSSKCIVAKQDYNFNKSFMCNADLLSLPKKTETREETDLEADIKHLDKDAMYIIENQTPIPLQFYQKVHAFRCS